MKEVNIIMLRELLSSRLILAGLVILVVVTGTCCYSWHVQRTDDADASLPVETPAEDVPVSPFGFGTYPEVPEGWDRTPSWLWTEEFKAELEEVVRDSLKERGKTFSDHLRTAELMHRVWIKLFNEGRNVAGITSHDSTGLFYPTEANVIYVTWDETTDPDGKVRRYISSGTGATGLLSQEERMGYEPIPDWIEVRSHEEGIDPYEYLGLDR